MRVQCEAGNRGALQDGRQPTHSPSRDGQPGVARLRGTGSGRLALLLADGFSHRRRQQMRWAEMAPRRSLAEGNGDPHSKWHEDRGAVPHAQQSAKGNASNSSHENARYDANRRSGRLRAGAKGLQNRRLRRARLTRRQTAFGSMATDAASAARSHRRPTPRCPVEPFGPISPVNRADARSPVAAGVVRYYEWKPWAMVGAHRDPFAGVSLPPGTRPRRAGGSTVLPPSKLSASCA